MGITSTTSIGTHANLRSIPGWTVLNWDTEKFGFPVVRITGVSALETALMSARAAGCVLAYYTVNPDEAIDPQLLSDFNGSLVDRKVTFQHCSLSGTQPADVDDSARIREWPVGAASQTLLELSRSAGWLSRFRVDSRMPAGLCDELYDTWIERSTQREIADLVLVAESTIDGRELGLITGTFRDRVCQIGLVSVHASQRGNGLGGRLIQAMHSAAWYAGNTRAEVVTQLDNHAACRCYTRAGYHIAQVQHVYHFWLRDLLRQQVKAA